MGSARYEGGTRHLTFVILPIEYGKKMDRYEVYNQQFETLIGHIHFRGGWRQYVFTALPDIDMSRSCHKEIDAFIDKLMKEWKDSIRD